MRAMAQGATFSPLSFLKKAVEQNNLQSAGGICAVCHSPEHL
jgi:hypothetical protein